MAASGSSSNSSGSGPRKRACLFAGLFFAAVFLMPCAGECGISRHDSLLLFALMAEKLSTFFGVWRYPNHMGAWALVHLCKWSSLSLLVVMTFTIAASLNYPMATIRVAQSA